MSACASLGSPEGSNVSESCLWLDCVECKDEEVSAKLSEDSEKDLENFRNASFMIYVPFVLFSSFFPFFFYYICNNLFVKGSQIYKELYGCVTIQSIEFNNQAKPTDEKKRRRTDFKYSFNIPYTICLSSCSSNTRVHVLETEHDPSPFLLSPCDDLFAKLTI